MTLYDISVRNTKGEQVPLDRYRGKVLLIVNTATGCGYTPQYKGLEALYEAYRAQGFEVLDFPCNQFKGQAPGTDEEIVAFCQLNYGTQFETFSKIKVNGADADPLFTHLKNHAPQDTGAAIKWNFTKFLVGRDGQVKARYEPKVKPEELTPDIEALL